MSQTEFMSESALFAFLIYLLLVLGLAWLSGRVRQKREFVNEYFLGSRNLGVWAFALTFAATNASGGSFMGFPSLVYTHGWVLALWIASYMTVPLVTTALLAKRLNHVARRSGAITVPDVLRDRFDNRQVGLTATLLLTFFMFFYLLAQFKAGSSILATLLRDVSIYQETVAWVAGWKDSIPFLTQTDSDYLLCLLVFAGSVIAYTTYGGFRAVVWTDVMQGIVMVFGVGVLLILVLSQVGGLPNATDQLSRMVPPRHGTARIQWTQGADNAGEALPKGAWLKKERDGGEWEVIRLKSLILFERDSRAADDVPVLILQTPEEKERIEPHPLNDSLEFEILTSETYARGDSEPGVYVRAPGPDRDQELGFLSMGMALSFFVFWAFGGAGQPSNMVRQMAFQSSGVLKRSIVMVTVYYGAIYFPLILIFCCARVLLPGMEIDPDRIMPELAQHVSWNAGWPWLAGLILAAPFAAVMSSVDSFLLMVSSGLVRDVYQRNINPDISQRGMKRLAYLVTALVGTAAVLAMLNPPMYLQHLIVFASGGLAGSFLMPVALSLYWPRMTASGAIAGMLGGCVTHLLLYCAGYMIEGRFTVYSFLGLQPFLWDLLGSAACCAIFSLSGKPPKTSLVRYWFYE